MTDYKKELTRLFKKYNPEKVKDVDALLKKFAGREAELLETIHLKYGQGEPGKRKQRIILLLALLMALLAAGSWYAANQGMFDFGAGDKEKMAEKKVDEKQKPATSEFTADEKADKNQEAQMDAGENDIEKESKRSVEKAPPRDAPISLSAPPVEYGVQIGLFSVADNPEVRKRLGDAQLELNILPTGKGTYMYVVGNDAELDQARARRDRLRQQSFPDAFVVGLRKGKRVNIYKD